MSRIRITIELDTDAPSAEDAGTPGELFTAAVLKSYTTYQRRVRSEQTKAGLRRARARGRVGGRPTVWTEAKASYALELYAAGTCTVTEIAELVGVSRASIYRLLLERRRPEVVEQAQ